jgi:hypothetical protein
MSFGVSAAPPTDSEQKVTKRTKFLSDGPYNLRFLSFLLFMISMPSVSHVTHGPTFLQTVFISMVILKLQDAIV